MRSTYDRSGGNADASHFLYQLSDKLNVTLDLEGPGILYFARFNHWHGSPWHFEVDGTDYGVEDGSTLDPMHPSPDSTMLPGRLFPKPLAWAWPVTQGADLSWVPIPFERSFRMAYERTHYGTGYYIFHRYVKGMPLSQPLQSWNTQTPPDQEVLDLISRAGSDLVPKPRTPEGEKIAIREEAGEVKLTGPGPHGVVTITQAPSTLRALEFSVPREHAIAFGRVRLRITWDDRPHPSIDAPVALFYGAGTLYNRDDREYLVQGFSLSIRFDAERVHLACYFPMPFFRKAQIELVGDEKASISGVRWSVRYAAYKDPINHVAYFHATYRNHENPTPGKDLVLLDTRDTEGGRDWSGHLVGTSLIFSHGAILRTLEGDPRFFFDDSQTPQAQGTGTEEWGGGGDYWERGKTMTLPFAGHPVGARSPQEAKDPEDLIESEYRYLLADLMPFGKNALIQLEHGGIDESSEHYEMVTCWYGVSSPSLVMTDELAVGDLASEKAHQYVSPDASDPAEITSRYEWGPDHFKGQEVYPAQTDRGRSTTGTSEFTLQLNPHNLGVMLRRKLDYSFPHQRAEVEVADAGSSPGGQEQPEWKPAGVWYLAGSNTCVYSNPRNELGAAKHVIQTSNRRFRDDEFLVARDLTEGRSAIRVRIRFTPVAIPLFPGAPPQKQAWSEMRYRAYCFIMPAFDPNA
jgi:hypothetical protein